MSLRGILTAGATAVGAALSWVAKRKGTDILTTTLAVPGVTFAVTAVTDVLNNNQERGSVGIAEAALSIGGSIAVGYMTGRGTDAFFNSAAVLGAYAVARAGIGMVDNNEPRQRHAFR